MFCAIFLHALTIAWKQTAFSISEFAFTVAAEQVCKTSPRKYAWQISEFTN